MRNYRNLLKKLLKAIDESDVGDDRCVVCGTGNADHYAGCAYEEVTRKLEGEERGALGKCERLVAGIMAKGELDDMAFVEAMGPLHEFVGTDEFRLVYRQVITSDWWKAFVERHGPSIVSATGGPSEAIRKMHADRRARERA